MTVKELMKDLEEYPPDAEIVYPNYSDSPDEYEETFYSVLMKDGRVYIR